ncbi:MAG: prepilin-type N-terminal cleavage/methylation domain-containing protein [Candidatus Pacebacteria bacterium]|nr:prepilin-type N-terminal cleavage/methylation domain-containing protein [Candidatus Paceibacterota bacterium]
MSARGFTLIELLVVIAIIGILASIVLASLSSARSSSRDTQRVGELQQILREVFASDIPGSGVSLGGGGCVFNAVLTNCSMLSKFTDPSGSTQTCSKVTPRTCEYTLTQPAGGGATPTTLNFQICATLENGGTLKNVYISSNRLQVTDGCP